MAKKILFTLLVIAFGILSMIAGMAAPESWRGSVRDWTEKVVSLLPIIGTKPNQSGPSESGGATVQTSAPKASASPSPVPSESLLVPTPPPDKGTYALRLGAFTSSTSADALADRARASLSLPVTVLAVVDTTAQSWWIVAAGAFTDQDEARRARMRVGAVFDNGETLPLILLPDKPPAPAAQ